MLVFYFQINRQVWALYKLFLADSFTMENQFMVMLIFRMTFLLNGETSVILQVHTIKSCRVKGRAPYEKFLNIDWIGFIEG